MQNSTQNTTFERGFFRRSFQEFDERSFFNALQERLQEQPYHRKNKGLKNTLLVLSYVLNAISALSASYFIYWLTETLTGLSILAYALAGIFLIFLEQLKRKSSNEFFQVYFFQKRTAIGWMALSLLCFALSVGSTYFGTEKGAVGFAPVATTLPIDASEQEIKDEIKRLEDENGDLKAQKNREGITFFPSQSAIKLNKQVIVSLRERLNKKQNQRENDDRVNQIEHTEKVKVTATTLAWILVFLELVFEGCIAYIWYYYYRSFVEWNEAQKQINNDNNEQENGSNLNKQIESLQKQIELLKNQSPTLPSSIPQSNGYTNHNSNSTTAQIGYFTEQKRKSLNNPYIDDKSCVQACTDVYTQNVNNLGDLYTIEHQYTKNGKVVTVHYTQEQVQARLNQWERGVEEAKQKSMNESVIENRKGWVRYWSDKLKHIQAKKSEIEKVK